MSTRSVSNKQIRDLQRITHLVAALVLVLYVYLPLGSMPLLTTTVVQFGVLPLLAATGLLMWQWTRLRKRLRNFLGSTAMPWRKRVAGPQGKR
jgi:archaellum biogenesis protein FlaJ (TadC family)